MNAGLGAEQAGIQALRSGCVCMNATKAIRPRTQTAPSQGHLHHPSKGCQPARGALRFARPPSSSVGRFASPGSSSLYHHPLLMPHFPVKHQIFNTRLLSVCMTGISYRRQISIPWVLRLFGFVFTFLVASNLFLLFSQLFTAIPPALLSSKGRETEAAS